MISNNIEERYNNGQIPLCYYCQLNGKSAQNNYNLCKQQMYEKLFDKRLEDNIKTQVQNIIENEIKALFKLL